jgi:hypothetical protein
MTAPFPFTHPLVLDGFPYEPPPWGGLGYYSASAEPAAVMFDSFAHRVVGALGREFLPVYRMADGEFQFLVGEVDPYPGGGWTEPARLRAKAGRALRRWSRRRAPTVWGESYAAEEHATALELLTAAVADVAREGIIGAYFMARTDRWGEGYLPAMWKWFAEQGITLDADNYVPFYSVYALLAGPRRVELLRGRHVLVVTHLTEARQAAIARGLEREGAASVQFLPISAGRSLFDTVDVGSVQRPVDVALVAAGIGTAAVLRQLAPLKVPAIDCGIAMECFIDPQRRWERPYLIATDRATPDELNRMRRF